MSLEYIHNIIHVRLSNRLTFRLRHFLCSVLISLQNGTGGLYLSKADIPESPVGFTGLGVGQMSDPTVASFDPIFWLHHW